jgi:hypothetical protein
MATPVLNNGIFFKDTSFAAGSHLDYYHLSNMGYTEENRKHDFGIIDIWALKQKAEMPLYSMASFGGKNVINVDGHYFEWGIPVVTDLPFMIEDISGVDYPGIDGQKFKILVSERAFGHGAIITYDKMNGKEMFVTDEPIVQRGDHFEYTVELVRSGKFDEYLDKKFLKAGTKLFRVGSAKGDYGQKFDDVQFKGGMRKFYNFVGLAEAHKTLSVSRWADMVKLRKDILEIYQIAGTNTDPSVNLSQLRSKFGSDVEFKSYVKNNLQSYRWLPKAEAALISEIGRDIENYLMWGKGGRINGQGADDIKMSVGLWKQLDNGNKIIFTKEAFSMKMFKNAIYNYFNGKVNFDRSDSGRMLVVQTGLAGMELIQAAIAKEVGGSGMLLNATDVKALTGDAMNLVWGVNWVGFNIPFLANVRFVVNPAFDNKVQNDIENPTIDGHPLTSYSYIIYDFNNEQGNDNIVLLKYAPDGDSGASDLHWNYQQGTSAYGGGNANKGFLSSGNFSGFVVNMFQRYPAIFVKDPTKVLKLVMKNPITGGSF